MRKPGPAGKITAMDMAHAIERLNCGDRLKAVARDLDVNVRTFQRKYDNAIKFGFDAFKETYRTGY